VKHDFRVHDGGTPPVDLSKAQLLGAANMPSFSAIDLVEEKTLKTDGGPTGFSRLDGGSDRGDVGWLTLDYVHGCSFIGATVLRRVNERGDMGPVVGARVILRLAGFGDGVVLFDCMTAASGQTIPLTHFAVWVDKGSRVRLEVTAPGCEGKVCRVALHAVVER
jgi:hypothetical protein